jgi:hypothetical protein
MFNFSHLVRKVAFVFLSVGTTVLTSGAGAQTNATPQTAPLAPTTAQPPTNSSPALPPDVAKLIGRMAPKDIVVVGQCDPPNPAPWCNAK